MIDFSVVPIGLRSLILRTAPGPKTPAIPVKAPGGLEPPEPIPDAENAYVQLKRYVESWPSEGHESYDLEFRRKTVAEDPASARRALERLHAFMDGSRPILGLPHAQTPVPEDFTWLELTAFERLSEAFHLRYALDGRADDLAAARRIGAICRHAQGPFLHFFIGAGIAQRTEDPNADLNQARREAVRWELARCLIPYAHLNGPWDPPRWYLPPIWNDERRAVQWLLAGNPEPFTPQATLDALIEERELMESGSVKALQGRAHDIAGDWPATMRGTETIEPLITPLNELRACRAALSTKKNALGDLQVARALLSAASLARFATA